MGPVVTRVLKGLNKKVAINEFTITKKGTTGVAKTTSTLKKI